MKRAAWLLLVALGTIALALLAWYMRSVVVLLVAAIFLGATLRPLGLRLQGIGVPRSLSVVLLALLIVVGVLFLVGVVGYAVAEEAPQLLRELQEEWLTLRTAWSDGAPWQQTLAANVGDPLNLDALVAALDSATSAPAADPPGPLGLLEQATGIEDAPATDAPAGDQSPTAPESATLDQTENASALLRLIVEAAGGAAGLLGQLIILVFVSIYWSLEHEWFERLWISLLPAHLRQPARATWRSVESNVGSHLRSEVLQSLIAFVLVWLLFRLLGIHQPLLYATIVALAWLVPLVGWLLALVVLVPVFILTPLWVAIAATVGLLAIFALLEFVVEPRLDKAREKLEIVGLVFAMILLEFFGILGLLLASSVAVALAAGTRTWAMERTEQRMVVKETAIDTLRARVEILRREVQEREEEMPARTRSLYERLEVLLAEAEPALRRRSALAKTVDDPQSVGKAAENGENVTRQRA